MKPQTITVVGAGGIGSWTALLLGRIGHRLFVWDHDSVEAHNIGGQLFRQGDVGSSKVSALQVIVGDFCPGLAISSFGEFTEAGGMVTDITILAVDNMAVRKMVFDKWVALQKNRPSSEDVRILLDGRLEGEQGIVYAVDSQSDITRWATEWFPDDKVDDGPCTMRSTSYNGAMIAANIVAVLNNKIANKLSGDAVREVPFKLFYGFPALMYDVTR